MSQTIKLAAAIKEMTWEEMDDFAARILETATDDNGEANDVRYISGVLNDDATVTLHE
jgi:hypothetical protein